MPLFNFSSGLSKYFLTSVMCTALLSGMAHAASVDTDGKVRFDSLDDMKKYVEEHKSRLADPKKKEGKAKKKSTGKRKAPGKAATIEQSQTVVPREYKVLAGYDYHDANGGGQNLYGRTYTAKLTQKMSTDKSQYFLLSYDDSNSRANSVYDDIRAVTGAYGQVWRGSRPGLIFNLGGYFTRGINDYSVTVVNDTYVDSGSAGAIGGFTQVIPVSAKGTVYAGSNFALSYLLVDRTPGTRQGLHATAYPSVEYNHRCTDALTAYARLTGIVSTNDVNLNGGGAMLLPAVGLDYTVGNYTLGARYTYEYFTHHRGDRIGVTVSRPF